MSQSFLSSSGLKMSATCTGFRQSHGISHAIPATLREIIDEEENILGELQETLCMDLKKRTDILQNVTKAAKRIWSGVSACQACTSRKIVKYEAFMIY